jgi:hypothetical protein
MIGEFPVAGNLAANFLQFPANAAMARVNSCNDSSVVSADPRIACSFGAGNLFCAGREFIRPGREFVRQGREHREKRARTHETSEFFYDTS